MVDATLNRLYYSLNEPTALSGVQRLYRKAKTIHPALKLERVKKWLQGQDAYTLHRPANRKLKAEPRVFVRHIDDQWAIDLCDMGNIAKYNRGIRYMLTCIDVFSKYAWAVPVATKDGRTVTEAMQTVLENTTRRPKRIESDRGKEFYNRPFRKLLDDNGIHLFSTTSRHKSATVERFNRTLKTLLYRAFRANDTLTWLDMLHEVLNVYNKRYHRSIKRAPADVSASNAQAVFSTLYSKKPRPGARYKEGLLVRISKVKRIFDKGYLPNYTEEVFKIVKVYQRRPYQYELADLMDEKIDGKFVAEELTPVRKDADSVWKIEKVLKRDRGGRYFVKWLGFPSKFNSWLDSIEIHQ
jgi:transposase InsO family protein